MNLREQFPEALKGKRVLIFWTTKAWNDGSDWPAFKVLDECNDGIFCAGVTRPDGLEHDGSKCFIPFEDVHDILEWRETP